MTWTSKANLRGPQGIPGPPATNAMYSLVWGAEKTTGPATVVRGTPIYGLPAKFGSALSGGILAAGTTAPEPDGTSLTIESWVYAPEVPPGSIANPVVAWSLGNAIWFGAVGGTGYATLCLSGETESRVNTARNICDGLWHHVAVEISRTASVTTLKGFWIDGISISGSAPTTGKAWVSTLHLRGLPTASAFDWTGSIDEVRLTIGNRYSGTFTKPSAPFTMDSRTILLGHLESNIMDVAVRSYPVRPSGIPGGSVTYTGPFQPTTWLTDDKWVKI